MTKAILIFILFDLLGFNLFCQDNPQIPCSDYPGIKDDFISGANPHKYFHTTDICDYSQNSACKIDFVYRIMKSSKTFIAPTDNNTKVENCEEFNVSLTNVGTLQTFCSFITYSASFVNIFKDLDNEPIVTYRDDEQHSITNFTAPGHLLHPGKVVRSIINNGEKIQVLTFGIGTNSSSIAASLNSNPDIVDCLWGYVDDKLKKEVTKQLNENLSDGARLLFDKGNDFSLFYYDETSLTADDKNLIFAQLNFKISKDGTQVYYSTDTKLEYPQTMSVIIIDLNNDGIPEIFVNFNDESYDYDGTTLIFSKNKQGKFHEIGGSIGGYSILPTSTNGFPDLLHYTHMNRAEINKYDGIKYKPFKEVPYEMGNQPTIIEFNDYYQRQKKLLK